jgi:hypothetical protein
MSVFLGFRVEGLGLLLRLGSGVAVLLGLQGFRVLGLGFRV